MEWFPSLLLLQCFLAAFRCFHGISYKTVRWLYRSSTASDIFPFPLFLSVSFSQMLAYQRRGKRDLVFGIGDSSRIALRITLCQWLLVRDTTLLINCMTLSTWNETFDVLYECLDISSLAPPLHIVDPKVISLLFPFRFHLDGFKMDKSLSQYTIGVYFTLQLMPCYSLIGVFAWMNNIISWDSGERERKKRKVENITIFPVRNFFLFSFNIVRHSIIMDMLYFGDSVPYSYQPGYKQGNYCDFPSACAYPGMSSIPNTACRFSSVPSSYGTYPLPPGACSGFFARKPARIKGSKQVLFIFFLRDNYQTVLISHFWKVKNRFFI